MRFMFTGDPAAEDQRLEPASVTMYGVTFPLRVPVDVGHLTEDQIAKLNWNSHFSVVSDGSKHPSKAMRDNDDDGVFDPTFTAPPAEAIGGRSVYARYHQAEIIDAGKADNAARAAKPKRQRSAAQLAFDERRKAKSAAKAKGNGDQG